jgi:Arc/MetJ-type ribon-helix-helix transcriptional regulator
LYYKGMTMKEDVITIRLSKWDIQRMNDAVDRGFFTNRSDFIRAAIRKMADNIDDVPPVVAEAIEKAKKMGLTLKDVERFSREARHELHSQSKKRLK